LELTEQKLVEIQQLQEKYLEAFEQNLFPVAILQERLQQVAKEKTQLEQKKNELSTQLSSSDTKVIPHELVRPLLEKFIEVYRNSSREGKKQLLQLPIGRISIRQLEKRSRTIHQIEIDFDFTEVNISKTFTLIHLLFRETDKEVAFSQSLPASDNKIPPYLQLFLPLFMIRFPTINVKLHPQQSGPLIE
jgi:site-specific DNA recombinase